MVDQSTGMVIDRIIANIIETEFEAFDTDTLQNAKDRILDTVGCLIGGASDPSNPELVNLIMDYSGKPESTILMYGGKVPACNAAMVNCILCRSFDYEPVSPVVEDNLAPGHVSGTTVMTAISLGEATGASGREIIAAMLLGDDLAARLLNTSAFTLELGWDGNGTANGLAATAIAGRLYSLNESQLRNAFGLALNQLSGSAQNIWEGNTAFKLPIGLAARNAIFSAQLAAAGWTAPKDPLFGTFGYYDLFTNGVRNEELLTKDLGKKYWGDRTFKPYPSCRGNHGVIDCALEIVNNNDIDTNDIKSVNLYMPPNSQRGFLGQPWEIGDFAHGNAIFNYKFSVAIALLKKAVKPEHFTADAIHDRITNDFIKNISLADLPEGISGMAIKVFMKNGNVYTAESKVARGDIAGNPITRDELIEKFRGNVEFANKHTKENADKLIGLIEDLENQDEIQEIIRLLVP
jgi:2-methylcitrate dehydratase PrpD